MVFKQPPQDPGELWRPIPKFPNYLISNINNGRIFSLLTGRILKPTADKRSDYLKIKLSSAKGISRTRYVHIMVANAFLLPIPGKNLVDHIDGNRRNCNLSNLQRVDESENTQNYWRRSPQGKRAIKLLAHALLFGKTRQNANYLSSKYGLSSTAVRKIWNGKTKSFRQLQLTAQDLTNYIGEYMNLMTEQSKVLEKIAKNYQELQASSKKVEELRKLLSEEESKLKELEKWGADLFQFVVNQASISEPQLQSQVSVVEQLPPTQVPTHMPLAFHEKLVLWLKEKGWSQAHLARELKVSQGTVCRWCKKTHEPKPEHLEALRKLGFQF